MIEAAVRAGDLVAGATRRLRDAGVERAGQEAWWIWEKLGGQSRLSSLARPGPPIPHSLVSHFQGAIARRSRGEPLAHVLGEAAFRHLVLRSDRRALIPRPETEGLVDLVLEHQRTGVVADIGTGTGCIALTLASEGDYDLVVAVEQDRATLELARSNFAASGLPVQLLAGDLSRTLGESRLDVLVSNPPYLTDAEYATLSPLVRDWEPERALRSGPDGLEATRILLAEGILVVRPGGWIVLEIDCSRAMQAAEAAVASGWLDVLVKDDLFGRARYLVARRSESL